MCSVSAWLPLNLQRHCVIASCSSSDSCSVPEFSRPLLLVIYITWWLGVTEATGAASEWCAHPREGASMWDPHAAQEGKLLPLLVVQVSNTLQADWCHLPHYISSSFCSIQPRLLVNISFPWGGWRQLSYHSVWQKAVVLSCPTESLN